MPISFSVMVDSLSPSLGKGTLNSPWIIKRTVNRFSKKTGGLSGNTENVGVSQRWMGINHYLAALKQQHLVERTKGTKARHVELSSKHMQHDEDAVVRPLAGLHAWVPNMWSPN